MNPRRTGLFRGMESELTGKGLVSGGTPSRKTENSDGIQSMLREKEESESIKE